MVPAPNNTNESFAETPSSKVPPIAGHWVYYRPYVGAYRPYYGGGYNRPYYGRGYRYRPYYG